MMERFCENTTAKSFITDVWRGCKYTPEIAQDSKINLKWMNSKMLEKTVHFFNVDFAENISTQGYPKISKMCYYIVVLKNLTKLKGMHQHRSLLSSCNLQLHRKRDAGIYRFPWVLRNFLGTLWKMENQRSYYNKDTSWSRKLFQKTDIVRENV